MGIEEVPTLNHTFYQPYLEFREVQDGLESKELIKGTLRINQKNYEEAFIPNPDGDAFLDILIMGVKDRNRAFNDDVVAVKLNDREQWIIRDSSSNDDLLSLISKTNLSNTANTAQPRRQGYCSVADYGDQTVPENFLQKTAKVVYIVEAKGSRVAVGTLRPTADFKRIWAIFSPRDTRAPRMLVPANCVPPGFFNRPQDFANFLFVAEVHNWPDSSKMARAKLHQSLGSAGEINAESQALLISNKIDTREFSEKALSCLPFVEGKPWTIDDDEIKKRKDFRSYTVFTIDPTTARDLDDALHIKRLSSGWEIGVHIADVSYFLKPDTELDKWAQKRATSVYLVEKVVPMLPRVLCEELCSLNPGVDRLTFSVVWRMDDNANITHERIGRSVIRSCAKLAYDHAQEMIDNPNKEFVDSDLPPIFNGKSIKEIKESVINLNNISQILKKQRIAKGSLRLNSTKLRFALASKNGMPLAVGGDQRKDANFLVEELMLLANMQIAKFIHKKYPETSLLRRHPPPKAKLVALLKDKLDMLDCSVEFKSGTSISQSLNEYMTNKNTSLVIYPALTQMVLRCMQLAVYFSSGTCDNFHHYALNVDFYTHFTSPIRRYPNIIVHRLLCAALDYSPPSDLAPEELEIVAEHCNAQKLKAKSVSDASSEMFFGLFIREIGMLKTVGVVINVLDLAFDVFLVKYNLVTRIYLDKLKLSRKAELLKGVSPILILNWNAKYASEVKESRLKCIKEMPKSIVKMDVEDELEENELILDNACEEETMERPIEDKTKQSLRAFTPVILLLTPVINSVRFTAVIEPTTDDFCLGEEEIRKILLI